jgi:hypothetical protein
MRKSPPPKKNPIFASTISHLCLRVPYYIRRSMVSIKKKELLVDLGVDRVLGDAQASEQMGG